MATDVSWILELNVQSGHETEFSALMQEMVSATQENEPGTLDYQWSTSADGSVCHIFERYVDSAAVMIHLGAFGERFAGRFLEILAPVRFVVYGSPSQEVKDALAGFQPSYMQPEAGFSRYDRGGP
ncbi:MAG: antibiotic biosynthesis monooxygenase [Gemmatimonadota bacterium]